MSQLVCLKSVFGAVDLTNVLMRAEILLLC